MKITVLERGGGVIMMRLNRYMDSLEVRERRNLAVSSAISISSSLVNAEDDVGVVGK